MSEVGLRRRVGWEKLEIRSHKEVSLSSPFTHCLSHFTLCESCSLPPLYSMIPKSVSLVLISAAPCLLTAQMSYRHHKLNLSETKPCFLTGFSVKSNNFCYLLSSVISTLLIVCKNILAPERSYRVTNTMQVGIISIFKRRNVRLREVSQTQAHRVNEWSPQCRSA